MLAGLYSIAVCLDYTSPRAILPSRSLTLAPRSSDVSNFKLSSGANRKCKSAAQFSANKAEVFGESFHCALLIGFVTED